MEMQAKDAVLSYGSWIKIDENGCELKKIIVKIPGQIKFILLFVLVVGTMWLSWDLSRQ